MSHKVKLTAPGWENYTGDFAAAQFVDGVSVTPLPRIMSDRIGAILQCELIDADDKSTGQAGEAARSIGATRIEMPSEKLEVMTPEAAAAERKAAMDRMLKNPASKLYTEQELEEIASKTGLKGLREIGDKWGVKERSITKLIHLILTAQSEYQARVIERDGQDKVARAKAEAEMLAKQRAREAEIDRLGRVLQPEQSDMDEIEAEAAKKLAEPAPAEVVETGKLEQQADASLVQAEATE